MNWLILTVWVTVLGIAGGVLLCKWKPAVGIALLAATVLFFGSVTAGTVICWEGPANETDQADYGLLLGCALEDGNATPEMLRRCEAALQWMKENPRSVLIVSGSDSTGQGRTEAAVMAAWLRNHGADPKKLLLEEHAGETRENLMYARALAEERGLKTDTVLIITSDYHQTRARYYADQLGQQAISLSCRTPVPTRLLASVRETYAFVKAWLIEPQVSCSSYVGEG